MYHPPLSRFIRMVSLIFFVSIVLKKAMIFFCVVVDFHLYAPLLLLLFCMELFVWHAFCEYMLFIARCVYVCVSVSRANELKFQFYLWLFLSFYCVVNLFDIKKRYAWNLKLCTKNITRLQTTIPFFTCTKSSSLILRIKTTVDSSLSAPRSHYLLHHWIPNKTRCSKYVLREKKAQ